MRVGGDETGVGYAYAFTGGPLLTTTEYDGGGNAVRPTTQTLDKLERPTAVQVTGTPTGQRTVVQLTYDGLDRVKTLTDAAGHTTAQTYLIDGTADAMQYPGGDQTQITKYDNGPRPTEIQDLSGNMQVAQTTQLEYADPEKLLTRISPNNGTPTTFSYDTAEGWLNAFTNTEGTVSATHSLFGDALGETTNYGTGDKTISYTYYPDGSRATAALPDGSTWTYLYDAVGRLVQLDDAKGGRSTRTAAWTYSDDGLITRRELRADGDVTAYTTYAYNAKGQLTQQRNYRHADPTDVLLSDYSNILYDGLGRLVSMDTAIPALPAYSGAQSYTYDFLDELTEDSLQSDQPHTFDFAYDNAGNPTSFKGDTHTYNANNQLTDAGFTYDAKGNPTMYHGADLAFTSDDRLAAFGAIMSAGYRGDGLRAWKETTEGRSYYVYDGDMLVAHLDATGAVTATDVWGADGLISHGNTFYLYDPLGNVAHRLNPDGTVIANDLYDAWGNLLACKTPAGDDYVPANGDVYGYMGQFGYVTDRETGLILTIHRYYDPEYGRWVTRDPIGYYGDINLYQYCDNNSVLKTDDSGYLPKPKPALINGVAKITSFINQAVGHHFIPWDSITRMPGLPTPIVELINNCITGPLIGGHGGNHKYYIQAVVELADGINKEKGIEYAEWTADEVADLLSRILSSSDSRISNLLAKVLPNITRPVGSVLKVTGSTAFLLVTLTLEASPAAKADTRSINEDWENFKHDIVVSELSGNDFYNSYTYPSMGWLSLYNY